MHAYLPLHVSAQFTYLFTFECIFHVVGQFGENCFFKEQSEMFLQIRDWHDALQCFSVHIIYLTLPVYFIPTKQSTSIKYNLYTNRKFTHTKIRNNANLINFTGNLRNCWISVRSTSSLHKNVAHEPRSRIFSFDRAEHWTLNTEQWSNENTKHWPVNANHRNLESELTLPQTCPCLGLLFGNARHVRISIA